MSPHHPLYLQCMSLYRSFLSISDTCEIDESLLDEWLAYEAVLSASVASGSLDPKSAAAISSIVASVHTVASAQVAMKQYSDQLVDSLSNQVLGLTVAGQHSQSRCPE